ncbi:MAG: hypothetical protein LQ352_006903 [Teloschistes flavicans]|nr:MAG: hypothetical protein LQ352_006903 [Teloschistes flavicans]
MSNRFFFGDSDSSESGEDSLPYPKPLPRAAFLTPDFDPATYLSTLRNRHQTLEDLRAELRDRSQDISKELLDLVNENYQEFLSLGSSLQGGDEKVEEVRLGLLGFKRDVEGLKRKVDERRLEVKELVAEKKEIRRQMQLGRTLLQMDQRLQELERSLMVTSNENHQENQVGVEDIELSDSWNEGDEGEGESIPVSRLRRHAQRYLLIQRMVKRVGPQHPFVINQGLRMERLRNTILLDLGNALKQIVAGDHEQVTKVLGIYRDLGEPQEVLKVLSERRP